MKKFARISLIGVALTLAGTGVSFADACGDAHNQVEATGQGARAALAATEQALPRTLATAEFRGLWLDRVQAELRAYFNDQAGPALLAIGVTDIDGAFQIWFSQTLEDLDDEGPGDAVDAAYRVAVSDALPEQRAQLENQIAAAHADVERQCAEARAAEERALGAAVGGFLGGGVFGGILGGAFGGLF